MIRVILADDEPASRLLLRQALEATGKVCVLGEAADGVECLRLMEQHRPDVLFLDIQMAELNGLEVAEIALESEQPPLIVFITGYDMYAVRAFELSALDYVVKPPDLAAFEERLGATLARIEESLWQARPEAVASAREVLARLFQENSHLAPTGKLPVRDFDEQSVRLLDPQRVVYAEATADRVWLQTDHKPYAALMPLDRLAERLGTDRFFRVTAAAVVNLEYVSHLLPHSDGSCDVLLQADQGRLLHTFVAPPEQARILLGRLGL